MEKINFIPRGSYILVTSNLVKKENNNLYQGKQAPEIKEVQRVVAKGPDALNVEIGDYVFMNMNNFVQTVKKQSTIKAGIGGHDMITEQIVIPFFSVPGSEEVYIKINSREIEGIIPDYNALPDSVKAFKTLKEFTLEQEAIEESAKKAMTKGIKFAEVTTQNGVGLITETGSGKIKMY